SRAGRERSRARGRAPSGIARGARIAQRVLGCLRGTLQPLARGPRSLGLSTPDQWPPMNRRFPSGQDGPGKAEKSHPVFHEGHASKTCPNHQRMLSPRAHRPDERARREAVLKSTDGGEDALKQIV
ncbi:unnamed protein product, partial [Prorocentrum cordatum]